MPTRRTEVSNRRFLVIAAGLLLIMISGSWFIGNAHAKGIVQTIDVGEPFDAQAHKQSLPVNQRVWINGTYSASKIDNATVEFVLEPGTSNLYVKSVLTITPSGGPALTWGGYTTSENKINYSYGPHYVQYETWDSYFKEWLILTEKPKTVEWQMTFDSRASVEQDADNYYVRFADKEISPFYITIPKPYVIDKNGINRQLSYSYNPGKNILTLNLDDVSLAYPLAVDPIYTVDSTGSVGVWPIMLVNTSNIPQIVYLGTSNLDTLLAVNSSSSWSITKIYDNTLTNQQAPLGATISTLNDLPIVSSPTDTEKVNIICWWDGSAWRSQVQNIVPAANTVKYALWPIGQSSSTNRVFSIWTNRTNGNVNVSIINDISGSTYTSSNFTISTFKNYNTGALNSSNIFNTFMDSDMEYYSITDADPPTISTLKPVGAILNTTRGSNSAAINPTTDFPAISYSPSDSGAYKPVSRDLNYSYFNNGIWYHEAAFTNTTAGMSYIGTINLNFNSSGYAYIVYVEAASGSSTNTANYQLNYIKRTGTNTWTNPNTIMGGNSIIYPPSIAFDANDGLHIAWFNDTTDDLMYYFEPLPSAGAGSAPVASFQQDKLAIIRGMSISLTDGSSNTPTTWDWYSPSAASCFDPFANVTDQNPSIFPGTSCKICLIATNAFGTDTSCEGSVWVSRPWVVF